MHYQVLLLVLVVHHPMQNHKRHELPPRLYGELDVDRLKTSRPRMRSVQLFRPELQS